MSDTAPTIEVDDATLDQEIAAVEGRAPAELLEDPHEDLETTVDESSTDGVSTDDVGDDLSADEGGDTQTASDETSAGDPAQSDSESDTASEEAQSWYEDESLQAVASSYGISAQELEGYSSQQDFERTMRLIDRSLVTESNRAAPPQPPRTPEQQQADQERQEVLDLNPDDYDEDTSKLIRKLQQVEQSQQQQAAQQEQFAQLHQELLAAQQNLEVQRAEVQFHEAANGLDEGLFGRTVDDGGKSVELNQGQQVARRQLWEAAGEVLVGMQANAVRRGQEFVKPPMSVLLKRAEVYAFSDELNERQRQAFHDQVAAQSRRRRPVPTHGRRGSNGAGRPAKEPDEVQRLMNDPDIDAFFKKADEEGVG